MSLSASTEIKMQKSNTTGRYATVNGLKLYYEIHGAGGTPLILLHGGGSTIETTFGRVLSFLAKNRQVIAVELQAHGHTEDRDRPLSFEQDADDVAALLWYLKVERADVFGFSNGGTTALQIGIRHPNLVRKLVVVSAMFRRDALYPDFWKFMNQATIEQMPVQLKDAYRRVAPNPDNLQILHDKCVERMLEFKDWRTEDVQSITAPTLIVIGDADVVRPEHAVEMFRLLPHANLAILPGGHGECIGEIEYADNHSKLPQATVSMVEEFLDAPMPEKK
jgi:pimeloyl-ACP methyl ester carboxylesterase